jgi:hypothetical protein
MSKMILFPKNAGYYKSYSVCSVLQKERRMPMANTRRPQGDGTIRKREDGRWEGRIIIGHKNNGTPICANLSNPFHLRTINSFA